jgi:hypothetical protein
MRRFISLSTAILLLAHGVLGCCWQHSHQCTACGHSFSLATLVGCCNCQDDNDARSSEPTEHPCRCRLECTGTCVYVPPQKSHIEAPLAGAFVDVVQAFRPLLLDRDESTRPGHFSDAPLRMHLLHQILLI